MIRVIEIHSLESMVLSSRLNSQTILNAGVVKS